MFTCFNISNISLILHPQIELTACKPQHFPSSKSYIFTHPQSAALLNQSEKLLCTQPFYAHSSIMKIIEQNLRKKIKQESKLIRWKMSSFILLLSMCLHQNFKIFQWHQKCFVLFSLFCKWRNFNFISLTTQELQEMLNYTWN